MDRLDWYGGQLGIRERICDPMWRADASNPVQDVLMELFGTEANDEKARKALLTHLDTLLALGISRSGEELLHIPEYEDARARQLGTSIAQSLATSKLDDWADRVGQLVPKLNETKSFAMVRRLLVGSLLKHWLEHGAQLPDASAAKVQDFLLKLYNAHRIGAVHKGVMEYLHVSKSGGTSWCHIAELNGCTTERYDKSYVCQIKKFDDKVRWLNMTFHMLQVPVYRVPQYVLKRRRLVATRGYNYYSNEYTVHGGHKGMDNAHMCSDFFNAIVLRDPLKRLVSHMKFVMWTMSGDRGYNDTLLFNRMYANRTSEFWQAAPCFHLCTIPLVAPALPQSLGPAIVDNYFVRSLLGEAAFHVPVGAVTPDMLRLAKHVLAQFDMVVVLEQASIVKNLITTYGVGWKYTLDDVHDKDSQIREAEFNTTAYIPEDLDKLLKAQTVDLDLYDFAKALAQLDPVVYSVVRKANVQPLPLEVGALQDDSPCGLLRLQNKEMLLAALGARRPVLQTTKMAAKAALKTAGSSSSSSNNRGLQGMKRRE
ncbi:hypothetical protein VOLCADRAFT_103443 [Volvox carteri f. nagariensis]|uniref:Sulfotransferase n=1 Tax=Volvox carteri f. nagariensis TaxID=3068 RepID=D8TLV4_VOLCA|nr:uncharacterized protein VOLCADRAFT_103443 [Volvox carteri f. nagariensis]EFJ51529.1 hypothetical protein VOLCADRAFT_103443 [Volvox carteri f. nagariensis]|eukprot:XP_002947481.1 hypothetical protein VOLCADRAFT_103443 [Volvox carteri f. nagariensis]